MARLDTAQRWVDDSGGYLGDVVLRIKTLHLAACQASRPDPRALARRMYALGGNSNWGWFHDGPEHYIDVLGEAGLHAFGAAIAAEWDALPAVAPSPAAGIMLRYEPGRYAITSWRLSLARARGSVDEVVEVLSRDLGEAHSFVRIAEVLGKADREREALGWLERGYAIFAWRDRLLAHGLIEAYLRDGQVDDAVAVAEAGFDAFETASSFLLLRRAYTIRGDWQLREAAALNRLRGQRGITGRPNRSEIIRVFMIDGDLDAAWGEFDEGDAFAQTLMELADASRATHPERAVAVYRETLVGALGGTSDRDYADVVHLLKAIDESSTSPLLRDEFLRLMEELRTTYRRRTRLIGKMDAARLP